MDATRVHGDDLLEGFLVAGAGRGLGLVLAGLAVLVSDLPRHLRDFGTVYQRVPLTDSRIGRYVLGHLGRRGDDFVPIEEVVEHYGDLVRPGLLPAVPPPDDRDANLARVLAEFAPDAGWGLEVGTGVGRGAFVMRGFLDRVLGIDRSVARVRRARNIAVTDSAFFLPAPPDSGLKELPLDLDQLSREGVDFAVGDAEALPLADEAVRVAVVRAGDGRGRFARPERVVAEAGRVVQRGGALVLEAALSAPDGAWSRRGASAGFVVYRRDA